MASCTRHPNGTWVVQFKGLDNKRKTLRLGKVTKRYAAEIKTRVEYLLSAALTGFALDQELSGWIADLSEQMHDRLYRCQLVPRRDTLEKITISKFVEWYCSSKSTAKDNSITNYRQAGRRLTTYFGVDCQMASIDARKADQFVQWLKSQYAEATCSRMIKFCKTFWKTAIRARYVAQNPFDDIKAGSMANSARLFTVTREITTAVLDACPSAEWRLLVALGRYGGLRIPSDLQELKWSDIDFAKDRFRVFSPKTGQTRIVPLFPELRPYLEDSYEIAPEGQIFCCPQYRKDGKNLRTQFCRIIRRAGFTPWERPFQNLRASRETELANQYPIHVAAAWIGNTAATAAKHYLSVTEENFQKATQNATVRQTEPESIEENSEGEKVESHGEYANSPVKSRTPSCQPLHPKGHEHTHIMPGNLLIEKQPDVIYDVNQDELEIVMLAWPNLSASQRKSIISIVKQKPRRDSRPAGQRVGGH